MLLSWLCVAPAKADAGAEARLAAWQALAGGGHVALLRHASAPGTGDPPGFRLDDCATQRQLSAAGRAEARAIGQALRDRGVAVGGVYTSQWCRCLETARLLDLGPVTPFPPLNSFFRDTAAQADRQTEQVRRWLSAQPVADTLVLVTHQVNITALTGVFPASGEIVVVARRTDGALQVVGRIPPP